MGILEDFVSVLKDPKQLVRRGCPRNSMTPVLQETVLVQDDKAFAQVSVSTMPSQNNRPRVVFCDVKHPIYGLYVVVPTTILDNRGLPHTLEHLIFTGSRNYPNRGYLDKLATVCLSTGTNAYTSEDHTCYFVTTAGFDCLLELLPVYLDHILYPTLLPDDMALEVFSLDESGKEARGVVYCEMKSRENTEADQMDLRLRNYAFRKAAAEMDPFLETYRWECGGASTRVSHLTPDEIRAYHQRFYNPESITIYISGMLNDDAKLKIVQKLEVFSVETRNDCIGQIDLLKGVPEIVPPLQGTFPSDDESIGSIGFSWLGPDSNDQENYLALHILMRALKETSASPLFQQFVECADPWASDIDYDVRGSKKSMISLIFSGVPNEYEEEAQDGEDTGDEDDMVDHICKLTPGLLKEKMFKVFENLFNDEEMLESIIKSTLTSFTLKIKEQYEEDPHELALGYCLPEILYGQNIGLAITTLPKTLLSLRQKPLEYWRSLMKIYLIDNECHEVIMRPSKTEAEKIKQIEVDNLKLVVELDKSPKIGTALLAEFSEVSMPNIKIPTNGSFSPKISTFSAPGLALHVVEIDSCSFTTISVGFNIKNNIPKEDWKYLVIFQELLFQCDISKLSSSDGILCKEFYSYQDLQRLLSSKFTTYEAGIGLGNELFSCSFLDSHLMFTLTFPSDSKEINPAKAIELILDVLKFSLINEDRIQVTIDNLLSQLAESKRDPSTVIDAVFYERLRLGSSEATDKKMKVEFNKDDQVSFSINIFEQEKLLNELKTCELSSLVSKMKSIATSILSQDETDCDLLKFVHIGASSFNASHVEEIEKIMGAKVLPLSEVFVAYPESLPRWSLLKDPMMGSIVVPMADVTAAFMGCSVLCPILPNSRGISSFNEEQLRLYLALALLCHMLSFTEGPLYNRVRGKGLAYGAYMSLSLWNGLLSFDLNDSTAPYEAFETFLTLVKDVLEECGRLLVDPASNGSILCGTTLSAAKASFAYTSLSERATPSSVFSLGLRSFIRGGYPIIESTAYGRFMTMLQSMTLAEIAKEAQPYLSLFLQPESRLSVTVLPPSMKETFCSKSPDNIIHNI